MTIAVLMAGEGALVAVLPAVTLPGLLPACAALQGAAVALAFRGLWHHRASYVPSRTTADPTATGPPAAARADAPRTA